MLHESLTDDGWVLGDECYWEAWDGYWETFRLSNKWEDEIYGGRNYQLFGVLAGVRYAVEPDFEVKGFPNDAHPLTRVLFEQWDSDAHTPSYIHLEEIGKWLDGNEEHDCFETLDKLYKDLKCSYPDGKDKRVVFWFDN